MLLQDGTLCAGNRGTVMGRDRRHARRLRLSSPGLPTFYELHVRLPILNEADRPITDRQRQLLEGQAGGFFASRT